MTSPPPGNGSEIESLARQYVDIVAKARAAKAGK
mgnify:CR=1 FL=1